MGNQGGNQTFKVSFMLQKTAHVAYGTEATGQPNQLLKKGDPMKIKRALSNLIILVSPGGTTTVCTR